MLKICDFHGISWDNAEYFGGCPMHHLHKMMEDDETEIRELKVRVRELNEPGLVAVINQELLEALRPYIDDEPCHFDHGDCETHGGMPCMNQRAKNAIRHAEKLAEKEKKELDPVDFDREERNIKLFADKKRKDQTEQ